MAKVTTALAAPLSAAGTAFWTAVSTTMGTMPMPTQVIRREISEE
ncbi:hypothetical protein [Actinacidiphila glaucinigra]